MLRLVIGVVLAALLSACGNDQGVDNSPAEVAAAAYTAPAPRSLTLITVVNNRTGRGGHTGLLINASQQVIFDPAGSFRHKDGVERADVIYGMTPRWFQAYKSAHARSTFHVVSQKIVVSPEQAEQALQLAMGNGPAPAAYCANATSTLLQKVPGFQNISTTFYPVELMDQFGALPGVETSKYYEDDDGNVVDAIRSGNLLEGQ